MDVSQRERLAELVEELTTSGQPQLNQDRMKEVKRLCKVSADCVEHVYHSVMSQLNQDHAEIRLSAFQIISELFSRSHHFRTLLVDNFQEFLELTVETDSEQPLPPPKDVAKKLKLSAIQTVQSWHSSYGSAYKKLALGFHFLKHVKKVDFSDVETRTVTQRRREEERQRRMERIHSERAEAAARDMEESYREIQATLTEMDSCLKLLLPDEEEEEEEEEGEEEEEEEEGEEEVLDEDMFIRNTGMISHSYSLDINLDPDLHVKETEENEAVVSMVIDLRKLITTKHLPAVQSWVQAFTRSGAEQQMLRRAMDLRMSLEAALQKHDELHIHYKTRVRRVVSSHLTS
ncbi:UV-stimulated scaffold protein A [Diretmus argenteus]